MFKTILAPIDGSDSAAKAAKLAAELAKTCDAELILLHVMLQGEAPEHLQHLAEIEHLVDTAAVSPSNLADAPAGIALALDEAARQQRSHLIFEKLGRQILEMAERTARKAGVEKVETRLVEGDPTHHIVKAAQDDGADVIVMGSRGLSDLKGLLVGSVSHKVNSVAPCSCITVK